MARVHFKGLTIFLSVLLVLFVGSVKRALTHPQEGSNQEQGQGQKQKSRSKLKKRAPRCCERKDEDEHEHGHIHIHAGDYEYEAEHEHEYKRERPQTIGVVFGSGHHAAIAIHWPRRIERFTLEGDDLDEVLPRLSKHTGLSIEFLRVKVRVKHEDDD